MIYQVSYVINRPKGKKKKAADNLDLVESDHYPQVGEMVTVEGKRYRIVEVVDLIPPRAQFCYVHALVEPA